MLEKFIKKMSAGNDKHGLVAWFTKVQNNCANTAHKI